LAHAMLEAHWRDDADLADRLTLASIGRSVGVDPDSLLDRATTREVQQVFWLTQSTPKPAAALVVLSR
jgi:2-hydroxychromene-2-carboxylate isomerase